MKVKLPPLPFDLPPKPREMTSATPTRLLTVRKIDASLIGDESGDYIDPADDEGVPMGKRQDWVIPAPEQG